jgi:hypothetical protein
MSVIDIIKSPDSPVNGYKLATNPKLYAKLPNGCKEQLQNGVKRVAYNFAAVE